ncbi:MAG: HAD-IC family P-type ATPase, partial [bacterium]
MHSNTDNNYLSTEEANTKLKQFGYNELPSAKSKNILLIAFEVMKEPMFLLLLSCASLYILLGDYNEGVILLSSVLLIIFITFFQHQKTEKSLDALRQLSSPRALVMRDGKEIRIPGREVVPGDLILLAEGDRIPADAEIIESNYLTVDESLLSGESLAVIKSKNSDDKSVFVYSGTLVVQGSAKAIVLHTGTNTQFGKIGKSLQSIVKDQTKLQLEMKLLIRNLFIGGAVISIGVVVLFYLKRGDFINSLLNGLAASMAILPEEFPVVLTIFLALGAWRLSKKKVLTRNASAIETLGSATVLCTDKTGTITQNRMQVANIYVGDQAYSKNDFRVKQDELREVLEVFYYASSANSIDPMEIAIANEFNIDNTLANHNLIK